MQTDKSVINFSVEGGQDSIVVTSTERWKLAKSAGADWVHLGRDSGNAGKTTIYLVAENNTTHKPRTAFLTINSVDNAISPVQVNINQTQDVKITWMPHLGASGGSIFSIEGSGFSPIADENIVTINGVKAVVQSSTNTLLRVTIPMQAGSGPIIVSVGDKKDTSYRIFNYTWIGIVTVLAGSTAGFADGVGTAAKFYQPGGLAFDAANNIYVTDYQNNKVRKITPGGVVSTMPGRFPSSNNPSGPNTDFGLPTDVGVDKNGNIFVVEFISNAISKITPSGIVSLFAGGGAVNESGPTSSFYHPVDLAIDVSGNVFVADREAYRIRKVTPGGVVSTLAGGVGGYQDGIGADARFNRPQGIDIDGSGNLYVCDLYNNRIRKVSPTGVVTTVAGTGGQGTDNGDALTEATFYQPSNIAVSTNGSIYISQLDRGLQIRIITPHGRVETIGQFLDATTGQLYEFKGTAHLAVDKDGTLIVSDVSHNRICKLFFK
jgi:sugar lactone lactonase YvrE